MTNTEEGGHVKAGAEAGGVQPEAKDGWSVREAARGEEGLSPRDIIQSVGLTPGFQTRTCPTVTASAQAA